jgi:ketosteroid isomerase-like protein
MNIQVDSILGFSNLRSILESMFTFVFLASLLLQGGNPAPCTTPAALDMRFVRDLHDKKIDDVLTLYTADAVFVNPDGTEVTGTGLRGLYEKVAATFDSDLHLKRNRFNRNRDQVEESGTYTEALGHRDSGKVENTDGTFHFVMRLGADGMWRYSRMEWH